MHIGISIFNTDYAIRIEELAREAEDRGFESLWVPEHTHIPTSRKTPYSLGGELPREYSHTLDPFIALTHAAAVTTKLRLGTGICLLIERDTITTAKEVASLDFQSHGRFLFGIGSGWNIEEMQNHGTDPATRFKRIREQVLAMKQIWTQEAAEYHGQFINFDPIWAWPKPVQKPHPPVLLGGHGRHTLQRVVDFCDGWFPLGLRGESIFTELADLKARAAHAGRDMKTIDVTVYSLPAEQATLDRFRAAGANRAVLRLPSEPRDRVLPLLDQFAKLSG